VLIGLYKHGVPVAAVGRSRIWWLSPRLRRLPELDPERHMLAWACRYLQDVQTGRLAGRLRSREAWHHARAVLIPDEALQATDDDHELAELLNVPLADVAAARRELDDAIAEADEAANVEHVHPAAPWLARALIIAGLWLTVMN
jgi:hypothetical protein